MAEIPPGHQGFSLWRWSQRKHAAARGVAAPEDRVTPGTPAATAAPVVGIHAGGDAPIAILPRGDEQSAGAPVAAASAAAPATSARVALPPLDSLTADSDYSPFMQPGVDDAVKRGALRKLFRDPQFNVMDGLDVYIDDYSKPDPIDDAVVRTLASARYIFNPPATRVNADGHVEDVPDAPAEATVPAAGDVQCRDETAIARDDALPPASIPDGDAPVRTDDADAASLATAESSDDDPSETARR